MSAPRIIIQACNGLDLNVRSRLLADGSLMIVIRSSSLNNADDPPADSPPVATGHLRLPRSTGIMNFGEAGQNVDPAHGLCSATPPPLYAPREPPPYTSSRSASPETSSLFVIPTTIAGEFFIQGDDVLPSPALGFPGEANEVVRAPRNPPQDPATLSAVDILESEPLS
jgi:hypothetical protein